jgi:UDP-N-acetylglucosamine 2-epimerase (non-hydrolysing)/GDP/UDP-N,N'-diacetylbacillosamine 2-epimerase (hydrolysing)
MRRICVVTGSRADYGLLYCVLKELKNDPGFTLQLVATGMHLAPAFGETWRAIEQDGFRIDEKVEMLLDTDTPVGVAKSIGRGTIGFADTLARLQPDLLLLLGDRFELLAAAQAALVANIPIAHIAGGDTTEGAFDEAIRHSITKMSHLHFVTNEDAARRVRQMGEDPAHVYNFGSPGIDTIRQLKLLDRPSLEQALRFPFRKRNLLVTFHPVTLEFRETDAQLDELLAALDRYSDFGILLTGPNADTRGSALAGKMQAFAKRHSNSSFHASLGQLGYLSAIAQVDAVVGNSSSGLYEVPTFRKPTVNIGDRQRGRLQASSVVNCPPERSAIRAAIDKALALDCSNVVNPYGDGNAAPRIVAALRSVPDFQMLVKKRFHETSQHTGAD